MSFPLKVFLFVALAGWFDACFAYTHKDQADWYDLDGECQLDRQSPIELLSREAVVSYIIPPINFNNYDKRYTSPAVLTNNGHSADLQIPKENQATLTGGPFHTDVYITESLHFHWGSRDYHGAEHVVDGNRYSMEMHIVHRNAKYASVSEATQHEDGLAVLGIFYNVDSSSGFAGLDKIVSSLQDIQEYNSSSEVNNLLLSELLVGTNTKEFYTYKGSLTTPPCSRAVTWVVFPKPISISEEQIIEYRSLIDSEGDPLVNNYRFLQAKGSREVYLRRNFYRDPENPTFYNGGTGISFSFGR